MIVAYIHPDRTLQLSWIIPNIPQSSLGLSTNRTVRYIEGKLLRRAAKVKGHSLDDTLTNLVRTYARLWYDTFTPDPDKSNIIRLSDCTADTIICDGIGKTSVRVVDDMIVFTRTSSSGDTQRRMYTLHDISRLSYRDLGLFHLVQRQVMEDAAVEWAKNAIQDSIVNLAQTIHIR